MFRILIETEPSARRRECETLSLRKFTGTARRFGVERLTPSSKMFYVEGNGPFRQRFDWNFEFHAKKSVYKVYYFRGFPDVYEIRGLNWLFFCRNNFSACDREQNRLSELRILKWNPIPLQLNRDQSQSPNSTFWRSDSVLSHMWVRHFRSKPMLNKPLKVSHSSSDGVRSVMNAKYFSVCKDFLLPFSTINLSLEMFTAEIYILRLAMFC